MNIACISPNVHQFINQANIEIYVTKVSSDFCSCDLRPSFVRVK